jgi:hypothetical protein
MPETFDYTLPPTPEHYLNGAYALTGYHCKTAPRQYSPLLCLYLPFVIALSAMAFLLFHNQARLSALLEECYLDQDTLDRITGISMNTVYIIAGCFVVFGIISQLFSRRMMKYIYHRNYLLHESRFTADRAGCRQIYPQRQDSWFGWAALDGVQTMKGSVLLIFGSAFIILPESVFADEAEKQGFIAQVNTWRQAAQKQPAPTPDKETQSV